MGISKEPPVSVKGSNDEFIGVEVFPLGVGPRSPAGVSKSRFRVSVVDQKVDWDVLLVGKTLVIEIPPTSLPEGSKESFVMVLEHAEEVMDCKKVVVSFRKSRTDRDTLIRTFMFLGFELVAPSLDLLSRSTDFIYMTYFIVSDSEDEDDDDDEYDDDDDSELDSEGEFRASV